MARMNLRTYLLLAAAMVGASATAGAQAVTINATKQEVLSLTLSAATLTNTDLAASNNIGSLTATLGWTLSPSRNAVVLAGYFTTPDALADAAPGGSSIAYADFAGSCTSSSLASPQYCSSAAEAFTSPNAALGLAGGSRILWASPVINGTNRIVSGATVGLNFIVTPTAIAALPAGTYSGVLNLRAYAQ